MCVSLFVSVSVWLCVCCVVWVAVSFNTTQYNTSPPPNKPMLSVAVDVWLVWKAQSDRYGTAWRQTTL